MQQQNKTYGFVIAIKELVETVPNLFRYASSYKRKSNIESKGLWEMFLKDKPAAEPPTPTESPPIQRDEPEPEPFSEELPEIDPESMEGENYNMCHFWSNFEIARLDFFRSREYEDFFHLMDRSGGFWAERVPPAPYRTNPSGAMHRYILSGQEYYSHLVKCTIFVTLATNTPTSNTVPPTPPRNNSPAPPTKTKNMIKRRETGTVHVKVASAVAANVPPTYLK
jgi:Glycolipid 2-alpha-mannosyltransferase